MPRIHGVGPRIAARIIEMGLVRADGKPDVRTFAKRFDYDKTLIYEWLADRRTPTKEVARLCADLQLTHGYLLYGEGSPLPYKPLLPIGGGSAPAGALGVLDIFRDAMDLLDFAGIRNVAYRTRAWLMATMMHPPLLAA